MDTVWFYVWVLVLGCAFITGCTMFCGGFTTQTHTTPQPAHTPMRRPTQNGILRNRNRRGLTVVV